MKEEDVVRYAIRKKAYFDLGSLNEENLLKAATYIDSLKEKQNYVENYIEKGLKVGE
ncbi:hypothetical protein [uncultured Metabacillus sp.]|uniref:hypothetical protein n=1 Tax=Metabacillus sp. Hm71 TaxID=3450743 RepID=UPI0026399AA7|nr:hypothetical protein [uncultured Metabacillus sp.]